jgi:mRNA interferase HicA
MRRTELMRKINRAAKAAGVEVRKVREGASHEMWECGGERFTVPRHTDINEYTAREIMKGLDSVLGEDWWR